MIDTSQTCRYLACLLGDHALPVTWQVFDDRKAGRVIPRHWPATLSESLPDLMEASASGAGIFVAVNECQGGRTAGNVVRVRALFADVDPGPGQPKPPEPAWHLPPSMVVETGRGWHAYWLCDDCPLADFEVAQKRLIAYYHSDPAIHDLPRVLRVPGWPHQKAEPRPVTLHHVADPRLVYPLATILQGLPEPAAPPAPAPRPRQALGQGQGQGAGGAGDWSTCDAAGLFRSAGLYRRDLGGGKHAVGCPWEAEHSTRAGEADTSTVLWEASGGSGGWPQFRCSHAHCDHRRWRDVVEALGPGLVAAHCERGEWKGERMAARVQAEVVPEPPEPWGGAPLPDDPQGISTGPSDPPGIRKPEPEAKPRPAVTYYWGDDLVSATFPTPPDVIGPRVLAAGDFGLLAGEPKCGKSLIAMDMIAAWCRGQPWHGLTVDHPLRVVVLQLEIGIGRYSERVKMLGLSDEDARALRGHLLVSDRCCPDIADLEAARVHGEQVRALLGADPDLLVIDPIAQIYTGRNENDNAEMATFLRQLRVWQRACGESTAMLAIHHVRKQGNGEGNGGKISPFEALRGAGALRGAYDAGIVITRANPADEEDRRRKVHFELRNGPALSRLTIEWCQGGYVACPDPATVAERRAETSYERHKAIAYLRDREEFNGRKHTQASLSQLVATELAMSPGGARKAVEATIKAGLMVLTGEPMPGGGRALGRPGR